MQLVLASSSPYRRNLLERLGLPFSCANPNIVETHLAGENIETMANRLALSKAQTLSSFYPNALIIGSDQTCMCENTIMGKPGNFETAKTQLRHCSSQQVDFYTALVLLNTTTGTWLQSIDKYSVTFRNLADAEIESYLNIEQPYDCAGSFKAEGLGISLFLSMSGSDFHSLIGLPLISLCNLLRASGLNPLLPTNSRPG